MTAAEAEAIRTELRRATERVNGDANLSAVGRQRALAPVYLSARNRMAVLKAKALEDDKAEVRRLERRVFGPPSEAGDIVSYRDAVERAEQAATSQQAEALLARAERIGDSQLARAALVVALEKGWDRVVDAYVEPRPEVAADISALAQAKGELNSPTSKMARSMTFSVSPPAELSGLNDSAIAEMAGAGPE